MGPVRPGKSALDGVAPRLNEMAVNLDRVLVVGIVGGTGHGQEHTHQRACGPARLRGRRCRSADDDSAGDRASSQRRSIVLAAVK